MKNLKKLLVLLMVFGFAFAIQTSTVKADDDVEIKDKYGRKIKEIEYYDKRRKKVEEIKVYTYFGRSDEEKTKSETKFHKNGKKKYYKFEAYALVKDDDDDDYDSEKVREYTIHYYKNGRKRIETDKRYNKTTDKMTSFKQTKFRSNGKKTTYEYRKYHRNGKISYKLYQKYNRRGQLKSNKHGNAYRTIYNYNYDGKLTRKTSYKFNKKGKLRNKKVKNYKVSKPKSKAVSAAQAKQIALKKTNGGRITDFETDYDDGIKLYEIEIEKGSCEFEMDILAHNGQIKDF